MSAEVFVTSVFQALIRHHNMKFSNKRDGFTIIELLIVIAIIGILAALLLSNFIGIRQRSRDAQRKADLRQIQAALEIYRSDQGEYPVTLSFPDCGDPLENEDGSVYMQKVPCDPLNSGESVYTYDSGGVEYSLYACLENVNDLSRDFPPDNDDNNALKCNGSTNWSYTLTNP
jgi:type II secretion system protein G